MDNLRVLLDDRAKSIGIQLSSKVIDDFIVYKDILKEWNEKINLTAIIDDEEIIIKHFIDSITVIPFINPKAKNLIDIGTGAGFPGIPIKVIMNNQIDVTLLDSLDKRIKFLDLVTSSLGLKTIKAIHGRAEDFGVKSEYREGFDIAVARAVASLPALLEYCLPFVKVGGNFIAMKGSSTDEIKQSKKALDLLGGEIEEIKEFELPKTDIKRNIIVVRKLRQTPSKYPRKAGKPTKEPLI